MLSLREEIGDERSLCFAVFYRIMDADRENGPLPPFIALPERGIATKYFSEPDHLAMLLRTERDDVGVNLKCPALAFNRPDAHRPILGEGLRAALFLKSKSVESGPRAGQTCLGIENGQINDAFATATWNRRAADVLNLQLGLHALDRPPNQARSLCDFWIIRAKLGGH